MEISYELDSSVCNSSLTDAARLKALAETGQMDSGPNEAIDRLTFLAANLLKVPLTIVSFVSDEKQYFKSFYGLPEPWSTEREIPLDVSVCQYTLVGKILSLKDASEHPLLSGNPALDALKLVGYLGVPLIDDEGNNLGAFCAVSNEPREWSDNDIEILKVLTKSVLTEIELGKRIKSLEKEKRDWQATIALLTHDIRSPIATAFSFSELALEKNDQSITKEALSSIKRSTFETLNLVDKLLDWKKETLLEISEDNKEHFNLIESIDEIVSDYEKSSNAKFIKDFTNNTPIVYGHKTTIIRAVRNLIGNAIKYGDLSKNITLTLNVDAEKVIFSTHNFGDTIAEEKIDSLFKVGKKTNPITNKVSWGFGLPQVAHAASLHFGAVNIKSEESFGTEITLSFLNRPISK